MDLPVKINVDSEDNKTMNALLDGFVSPSRHNAGMVHLLDHKPPH